MNRKHLFEIEDQTWCPNFLRAAMTEFLATASRLTKLWAPTAPVLLDLLKTCEENQIVVMGAGSGGGILDIVDKLPRNTKVVLTDLFPNSGFKSADPRIIYLSEPVNAAAPANLTGVRVMFASFHHLRPELGKAVLANAVASGQPVAIFEATERSVKGLLSGLLIPIIVLAVTPFIRPFSWRRLLFTYIIPVLPIAIFWDGMVSALRTYSESEMRELTEGFPSFDWKIKTLRGPRGESLPSLTGVPR